MLNLFFIHIHYWHWFIIRILWIWLMLLLFNMTIMVWIYIAKRLSALFLVLAILLMLWLLHQILWPIHKLNIWAFIHLIIPCRFYLRLFFVFNKIVSEPKFPIIILFSLILFFTNFFYAFSLPVCSITLIFWILFNLLSLMLVLCQYRLFCSQLNCSLDVSWA